MNKFVLFAMLASMVPACGHVHPDQFREMERWTLRNLQRVNQHTATVTDAVYAMAQLLPIKDRLKIVHTFRKLGRIPLMMREMMFEAERTLTDNLELHREVVRTAVYELLFSGDDAGFCVAHLKAVIMSAYKDPSDFRVYGKTYALMCKKNIKQRR